jgi:hypothetical protein
MDNRFLSFNHLQAFVGAEVGAYSAMDADDRFFSFFIEVDRPHDARRFAGPAADAFFCFHDDAAPRAFFDGMAWTRLHACRLMAAKAHYGYEAAGHAARGADFDGTLAEGVIFFVCRRAHAHAGKTTQALVHFLWLK